MNERDIGELQKKIVAGVKSAIAHALEEHRKAGRAVPILRDGKVLRILPEPVRDIVLRDQFPQCQ